MNKEDKQLLLKDLCSRLPYGVKVQVCNATEFTPILKGILGDALFLQFDYITKPIKIEGRKLKTKRISNNNNQNKI